MHNLYPVLAIAIVVAAALSGLVPRAKKKIYELDKPWPVVARPALTGPEQLVYTRLSEALPEHIVLAQVQLNQIIRPKAMRDDRALRWRYDRLTADFVICNKDFTVLAVIELDDASHRQAARRDADARKNHLLKSAGLLLVRWTLQSMPKGPEIRKSLGMPDAL